MNRVQLIGRLGRDPEGRQGATGAYAHLSLATKEYWTDRATGERVDHTEWHHLVCYDRLAEVALAFLTKGSEVYVEGRIRSTRRADKEGIEQRGTEVRIDELRMLRRAASTDPLTLAATHLAAVEALARDAAAGQRDDVTLADLASMLGTVRAGLTRGESFEVAGAVRQPFGSL
ncbi:MAG: single-stranded DNA-binding protein [Comamonadaceae bacterium]|nr:MAG: single-stranded DNA-binding protein [Comamonadaceae bacterium]